MKKNVRGVKMHVTLPPETSERLDLMAERLGISRSACISIAINEKAKREEGKGEQA